MKIGKDGTQAVILTSSTYITEDNSEDEYSSYIGFTYQEVKSIMNYYGVSKKESELKEWYDGYLLLEDVLETATVYKSEILSHLLQQAIMEYMNNSMSFFDAGSEGFYHD